jgi:predicted nuclease of restriction endonuclease-like RecB superfamily
MLTGKMVRVRYGRNNRVLPHYLDAGDPGWLEVAERLLSLYRVAEGRTRGELEEEQQEILGDDPGQLVHQGLVKLLEDRCEYEVASGRPPEELRAVAFRRAAERRKAAGPGDDPRHPPPFERDTVLTEAAAELELTPEQVEQGLFADLRSEQRLVRFKDLSAGRLLQRYNVGLAQAVLLRAVGVQVTVRGEPPQRHRQLLRFVKFHRLMCEAERVEPDGLRLRLDGPLSLFSATQKYGLQLALFLPAVLLCRDFELEAELRWGPERKLKTLLVTPRDGLVSHLTDSGVYVPPELGMFVELFRKRIERWDIEEESEVFPLGPGFWVPDFRLRQRQTGRVVRLEVLGFWRKASAERHLERLRQHVQEPFLLAVSDSLHIEEAELEGLPAGIHRFRNMPLPDEIARLADEVAG